MTASKQHFVGQIIPQHGRPQNVEFIAKERPNITSAERAAGVQWVDNRYNEGEVLRYGENTEPGVTDMAAAIQIALDVVSPTGGTIFFHAGQYMVKSSITSTTFRAALFLGEGRHDFLSGENSGTVEIVTDQAIIIFDLGSSTVTNASGPTFQNLGFRDIGTTALGAVRLNAMNHTRWIDLQFKNFEAAGAVNVDIDGGTAAGFLHEFRGVEMRDGVTGLRTDGQAAATRWDGGYIAAHTTGIDQVDVASELFFSGNIDSCTTAIDIGGIAIISARSRFEQNTTAILTGRSNNVIGGYYANNTTDINITGGTNNLITGITKPTGTMTITDSGTNTRYIDKFQITHEDITAFGSFHSRRGVGISQLTADVNDYNPSGAGLWILSSDASRTITGIGAGVDGRRLTLRNNGSFNIVLAHQSGSSTAANRIITGNAAASHTLLPDDTVSLFYDSAASRWCVET